MNIPHFKIGLLGLKTPFEFAKNPLLFVEKGFTELGDTFLVKMFRYPILVSRDPAVFRHVLQQNNKNYIKARAVAVLKLSLGNGLLTSEGDFWLRQRRLAQPAFHRERLQELFRTMGEITADFLKELEKSRNKSVVDIDAMMMGLTADIALKTLFSTITNEDKSKIYLQMNRSQEYIIQRVRRPYTIPFMGINGANNQFKADMDFFDKMVYGIIIERRKSNVPQNDLLQLFLDSIDEETGERMTDTQVRDEAVTMFAAGHETSANGLNWLLLELSKQPEVVAKIRSECAIFEDVPTFQNLMSMPYTRQVVDESLRLFPPAWAVGREPLADDEVNGLQIKTNMSVFLPTYSLHRNPNIWQKPNEFNPENFSAENVKKRSKFDYLPFGAGARICIGQQFALMEMQMILASIIKKFSFEIDPANPSEMFPMIVLKPKNGLKMFVK